MENIRKIRLPADIAGLGARKRRSYLCELAETINTDSCSPRKEKPLKIRVDLNTGRRMTQILVSKYKLETPTIAIVGEKRYTRSFTHGNLALESIVRNNLGSFVDGVRRAVFQMVEENLFPNDEGGQNIQFPLSEVERYCKNYDGLVSQSLSAQGIEFVDSKGGRLGGKVVFQYAIGQFFKDSDFALKLCKGAIVEAAFGKNEK